MQKEDRVIYDTETGVVENTPRQIFIAEGLGYELPQYAHVPFVAEPGT